MDTTTKTHPMTEAPNATARRCFYAGTPGLAYLGRNGYVNVSLLSDPGFGSMNITGTAPGNVTWCIYTRKVIGTGRDDEGKDNEQDGYRSGQPLH